MSEERTNCLEPSGSPRCDNCKWGAELEHRYDQRHCINEDSPEAFGDVEASSSCQFFQENAADDTRDLSRCEKRDVRNNLMKKMTIEDLSRIQRGQAWERAKGELRSMLVTFYSPANACEGQFESFDKALCEFIEKVEGDALHE